MCMRSGQYESIPVSGESSAHYSDFGCLLCANVLFGWPIITGAGSAMHFIYKLTDCNPVAGFFCAVNESVYEHAKIMLFPMLFWWVMVAFVTSRISDALNAATGAMYSSVCVLLVFNGMSQLAGGESLIYDIFLFITSIFCGQSFGSVVFYNRWYLCWCVFLLPMVLMLSLCTYFPPQWPYIFEDHRNGTYGRPEHCI